MVPSATPRRGRVAREVGVVVDLVPRDVQRDGRRDAGVAVDLGGVGDLLVGVARDALLGEDLEARAGVAERPRGQLDPLGPERRGDCLVAGHVCLRRRPGRVDRVVSRGRRIVRAVSGPAGGAGRAGGGGVTSAPPDRSATSRGQFGSSCRPSCPAPRDSLPQVSIDFNFFLDIAFTFDLLCAGTESKPVSRVRLARSLGVP